MLIFSLLISQDGGGGSTTGNAGASTQSINAKIPSKNGNIFSDGIKDAVIIAATKQLTKKDKRGSSAALQTVSIDASDSTYLEKTSPSMQTKRKSSNVEVALNGPVNSIDLVQMSSFANGNPVINEEGKPSPTSANGDYTTVDASLTDTNSDLSSIISEHNNSNKPATATNNNMQISQV